MKLQIFWKSNNQNNIKWKLNAFNAIIRSKLLYGLETVHLTKSMIKKLNAFQLRGIRKILQIPTTYIDRSNTNSNVFQLANDAIRSSSRIPPLPIKSFSEILWEKRYSLMSHVIRANHNDPLRMMSYQQHSANPINYGKKRIGGPKQQWIYQTNKHYYDHVIGYEGSYDSSEQQNRNIF